MPPPAPKGLGMGLKARDKGPDGASTALTAAGGPSGPGLLPARRNKAPVRARPATMEEKLKMELGDDADVARWLSIIHSDEKASIPDHEAFSDPYIGGHARPAALELLEASSSGAASAMDEGSGEAGGSAEGPAEGPAEELPAKKPKSAEDPAASMLQALGGGGGGAGGLMQMMQSPGIQQMMEQMMGGGGLGGMMGAGNGASPMQGLLPMMGGMGGMGGMGAQGPPKPKTLPQVLQENLPQVRELRVLSRVVKGLTCRMKRGALCSAARLRCAAPTRRRTSGAGCRSCSPTCGAGSRSGRPSCRLATCASSPRPT